MTRKEIEAIKDEILEAIQEFNEHGRGSPGVQIVISRTALGRSAYNLSNVRWLFDLMAEERLIRIVGENAGGDFALILLRRGRERLELDEGESIGEMSKELSPAKGVVRVSAPPNPAQVFISYGGPDKEFAKKLAEDLHNVVGLCWFADWEIRSGDPIRQRIEEGLNSSEFFIVVLSKASIIRQWVNNEVNTAMDLHADGKMKKIIPIAVDDCEIPALLKGFRYERLVTDGYDTVLSRVMDSISGKPTPTQAKGE